MEVYKRLRGRDHAKENVSTPQGHSIEKEQVDMMKAADVTSRNVTESKLRTSAGNEAP